MNPSRALTADKRYYGVAEAVVTSVDDPEQEGRVKVQFPWFDPGMDSDWCRVAQIYAGKGYGAFWVPEIDDEVIVGFVQGDMRFPIVLGGLYNGVDKPPTHRDSSTDQKMFQTKAGHILLFDDTSGQERVQLTTKGGHEVTMDDAGQSVTVETSSGQKITMDASSITIEAKASVTVKGGASVTVDAPSIKLGAAAAQSLVLGEALMAVYNLHTHNCTAPGAPSGPPLSPMTPAVLSATNKTA